MQRPHCQNDGVRCRAKDGSLPWPPTVRRKLRELRTGGPGIGVWPVSLSGPVYRGGESQHQKRVTIGLSDLLDFTATEGTAGNPALWSDRHLEVFDTRNAGPLGR